MLKGDGLTTPERVVVAEAEIDALLERIRPQIDPADFDQVRNLIHTTVRLSQSLEQKNMSLKKLRDMIFGPKTETMENLLGPQGTGKEEGEAQDGQKDAGTDDGQGKGADSQKKGKGHGRNGSDKYTGAERKNVPLEDFTPGMPCPECHRGKLYPIKGGVSLVRVTGAPALPATVWELEKCRCNLCNYTRTAPTPDGVGEEKYDAAAASMIAMLKYGAGMPWYRLGKLQGNLGVPLSPSTQWDIVSDAVAKVVWSYEELLFLAAQGKVIHNDDTNAKILEFMGKRAQKAPRTDEDSPQRTGMFTTGIISLIDGQKVALYFTGKKHAGENLASLLANRCTDLGAPIQMCDGLDRNVPKDFETVLGNCMVHSRRKYADVVANFPEECGHVIRTLAEVYRIDAQARGLELDDDQRLTLHQTESQPLMDELHCWLHEQTDKKKVEPNSGLGQAIKYMTERWERLTLFLRVPGAPLDNNVVEQSLKKVILHRKNAMFFLTDKGASVADIYMSLIHTCELCGANAFDYLKALIEHQDVGRLNPKAWMPWSYKAALAELKTEALSQPP